MDRDFTEIYKEYRDMIYNYMYWKTGNSEEALDLTQEVFLKIYKNLRKFRGESSLKTWIMKIATNHANSFFSRSKFRKLLSFNKSIEYLQDTKNENNGLKLEVENALLKLRKKEREIIVLYYMEGFSYKEISTLLGIPIGTVKSRLNRAKENLKKILGDNYGK